MIGISLARFKGPTNVSAAPHETRNHLVYSLPVEAPLTFVYKNYPVWDFNGFEHISVDPSKCVITSPRQTPMKRTHIFHAPFSGCFMQVTHFIIRGGGNVHTTLGFLDAGL